MPVQPEKTSERPRNCNYFQKIKPGKIEKNSSRYQPLGSGVPEVVFLGIFTFVTKVENQKKKLFRNTSVLKTLQVFYTDIMLINSNITANLLQFAADNYFRRSNTDFEKWKSSSGHCPP